MGDSMLDALQAAAEQHGPQIGRVDSIETSDEDNEDVFHEAVGDYGDGGFGGQLDEMDEGDEEEHARTGGELFDDELSGSPSRQPGHLAVVYSQDVDGTIEAIIPEALDPLYEEEEEHHEGEEQDGMVDRNLYYDDANQGSVSTIQESVGEIPTMAYGHRNSLRRSVQSIQSLHSLQSIQSEGSSLSGFPGDSSGTGSDDNKSQRRVTLAAGDGTGQSHARRSSFMKAASKRRSGYYMQSTQATIETSDEGSSENTSGRKSSRSRSVFNNRRSMQTPSRKRNSTVVHEGSLSNMDIAGAADRLEATDSGAWDHTVAAAAIVAASAAAPAASRNTRQYSTDDGVLVMLTILNVTNQEDDKADYTIAPVNIYGYPSGQGKTDAEKNGPYSYLFCTVTKVHFDEDERYYTIARGDTGTEQRADPSWMEPLLSVEGMEAAMKAASVTKNSEQDEEDKPRPGLLKTIISVIHRPSQTVKSSIVPIYQSTYVRAKILLTHVLHGDSGFACKAKVTGINFLVASSFIYLFLESVTLAFLPAHVDFQMTLLELCVWIILLMELGFEYLIRPENYRDLRQSDRAYAPTTARNINFFHIFTESLALLLFIPKFFCLFNRDKCGDRIFFSPMYAAINAITHEDAGRSLLNRTILGLQFLKVFGLIRHWKQMWLSNNFEHDNSNSKIVRRALLLGTYNKQLGSNLLSSYLSLPLIRRNRKNSSRDDGDSSSSEFSLEDEPAEQASAGVSEEDRQLRKAATIGTALMLLNSHRALLFLLVIMMVFPAFFGISGRNFVNEKMVDLLQGINLESNTTADCDFLELSVKSWLHANAEDHSTHNYLLQDKVPLQVVWAQLLPVRCPWQEGTNGIITNCRQILGYVGSDDARLQACATWNTSFDPDFMSRSSFADDLDLRPGELLSHDAFMVADFETPGNTTEYRVAAIFDMSATVASIFTSLFMLLLALFLGVLIGLTVMRGDAGRLVLNPLQRMLKIIVRYAENPLSDSLSGRKSTKKDKDGDSGLGNYETEQLISAIAKIADLLRKCWGVAGAGIISTNLARTKDGKTVVFNPTVPGKRVYALFGFVAINDFSKLLRVLESDVMILINDVARVVHDEVYRWSLGDSGQCNKNLGAAFLMVFRIGDFSEVHDKKKRATEKVFDSRARNVKKRKKKKLTKVRPGRRGSISLQQETSLQLSSLPGIQSFTDRALLGLLKSFAGINRDQKLQRWKKDFRLGAGVEAFGVSVIFGMDAGWAVEGAVGSEYKIDATYLSPHVNMASRMMSATNQYGVTILMSQDVEQLLSKQCRRKLRHLDTVFVKGSHVAQRIFTYDARHEGVDFFLYDRSPEQADLDSETYSVHTWETDQDLKYMRQHISDEFMDVFKRGLDHYLAGKWKEAVTFLKKANNLMLEQVIEEGYVEGDFSGFGKEIYDPNSKDDEIVRLRQHYGDGASMNLVQYMERRDCVPPSDWNGVRKLMSK